MTVNSDVLGYDFNRFLAYKVSQVERAYNTLIKDVKSLIFQEAVKFVKKKND